MGGLGGHRYGKSIVDVDNGNVFLFRDKAKALVERRQITRSTTQTSL